MPDCGSEIEHQIDDKHATRINRKKPTRRIDGDTAVANLRIECQHRTRREDALRGIVCPCPTTGVQGLAA